MRTVLSTELPPVEKAVWLFATIGGSIIMIGAPFLFETHLDLAYYLFGFPLVLACCAYLVSRMFKFKNVHFDREHLFVESKGGELLIPLNCVTDITQIVSQCWVRYTENGQSKSLHFMLRTSPIFLDGGLGGTVAEFRKVVSNAKKI